MTPEELSELADDLLYRLLGHTNSELLAKKHMLCAFRRVQEEALKAERTCTVAYLRWTLALNHPHLHDAYEHAAKNIEMGAAALPALREEG